jgi:hypothetical protein
MSPLFHNPLGVVLALQKGEFAARLGEMLWSAYGPLIKFAAVVVLIFVVVLPVLGFIKKIFR